MLNEEDEDYKKKKERAKQLRNFAGMTTYNDYLADEERIKQKMDELWNDNANSNVSTIENNINNTLINRSAKNLLANATKIKTTEKQNIDVPNITIDQNVKKSTQSNQKLITPIPNNPFKNTEKNKMQNIVNHVAGKNVVREASERNAQIEKGGSEAFFATTRTILGNIEGGAESSVAGLVNVATTAMAFGVRGLETWANIFGNDNMANKLNDMYNNLIDFGSDIKEDAEYESNVTARLNNKAVKTMGQVTNTISEMVTNQAIGVALGVDGTIMQGLSVGGRSAQEVLDENKDNIGKATITGIAKGYTSYLTEKMFDANILTRGQGGSISDKVDDLIYNTIKSKFGKEFANKTIGVIGENIEELIEDNIDNIIDKLINDKDLPSMQEWWKNTTETAKITTLSTIIMDLLGLGGGRFEDKEPNIIERKVQKIIDDGGLAIKYNNNINQADIGQFYTTTFNQDGTLKGIELTSGKQIVNVNNKLNIQPVIIKKANTNIYNVIDGNTGLLLDNSPYTSALSAEQWFDHKIINLDEASIQGINNKVAKSNVALQDKIVEVITETEQQLNNMPQKSTEQPQNSNINSETTNYMGNVENVENNVSKYLNKMTKQFKDKQSYKKDDIINIWENIVDNNYGVTYVSNNSKSYIDFEKSKDILKINQYDDNGNVLNSINIIPNEDGTYSGKNIKNAIIRVSNNSVEGQLNTSKSNLKMENRTYENVSNKNVKPYAEEHQEISQYIKNMAANFMEDLEYSLPGKRYKAGDTWTGQKRSTTKELAEFKDATGVSWDKIGNILNDIYEGNGNYALAKKMEIELDKALTEGYKNIYGQTIMPNESYLDKKEKIEGKSYRKIDNIEDTDYDNIDLDIFSMKKKNGKVAKNSNIEYNKDGIKLGKREYANVMSLIATNNTNNSNGIDSIFSSNYFYIYDNDGFNNNKIIAKIEIEGNESLIDNLRKEIKNGVNKGTENISNTIQAARNVRKSNNSNNVSDKRTRANEQTTRLYNTTGRQGREIEQRRNSQESIRNKSKLENSKQSSFSMEKDNTGTKKIETIYRKFSKDFKDKGYIDLNNKKVNNAKEVADIAQVFRNPNYETFRMLYTKGNTIVGQEAISSRIPGQTKVFEYNNREKGFYKIKDRMKRLAADGYYMVHNHPSGKAVASQIDINTTQLFAKNIPGFKGHVIVNSGTYAIIERENGNLSRLIVHNEMIIENYKPDEIDKLISTEPWTDIKLNSNNQIAMLMHDVKNNPNYSTLILADSQSYPRILLDIPNSFFNMKSAQIDGYIKNISKQNGATIAFIATTNSDVYKSSNKLSTITDSILYSVKDNEIYEEDTISKHNKERTKTRVFNESNLKVKNNKNNDIRSMEKNNTEVDNLGRKLTKEQQRYFADSNVRNEKGDYENKKRSISSSNNANKIALDKTSETNEASTSTTSIPQNQKNVNTTKKTSDIEAGQRNAERTDAYIEQEIKKIEATGKWDDSIPITKMTDIRKSIEDYLGIGIQKGHFRQRAYAIYNTKNDNIRTKEFKDMDSILHEVGHAIDLGNRISVDKESIADELLTAINKYGGYEGNPRSILLDEGFAEVIREYAIIPEQAKKDYPQSVAVLEGIRANDESFDKFISNTQKQIYNYIHQSPQNRVMSNLSVGEQTDKVPLTKKTLKEKIVKLVWDKDYALKSAVNELSNGKKLDPSQNAYLLTRLASGVNNKAISIITNGYISLDGTKTFQGLGKLGEILGNNEHRFNDLRAYLVAQRDLEYKAKTLKTGIRTMDSQAVVDKFKNDTQIQRAAKVVYDTLNGVLQYAVDNGLITRADADILRQDNAFYVPFQRVIENNGNQVGKRGEVKDIIKRRTGSELDVKDVLENIVVNSTNIIKQVENNNILRALYKEGESAGIMNNIFEKIPAPMKKIGTENLAIWEKELKNQGIDTDNIDLEKTIDIFVPDNKTDVGNRITSFIDEDGKRVYLQFSEDSTDIFNTIMNLDSKTMSMVLKINSKLNMPLRYGATMANVGFAIPNMISDTAQAMIYSEAGFIPVVDNALGVLDILTATNKSVAKFMDKVAPEYANRINRLYTIYEQSGATSATRMSQYRKSTQEIMRDVYGTKNSEVLGIKESFKPLKRLLDIMTYIPEISEQSTRFRVFEKNYSNSIVKGNTELDARIKAAIESRDATQDFGRTGNLTREINQIIPFSAARVGSAYTFTEKIKANPKATSMRIAILTAIAIGIKAIGYDDKEIEELNQRKKDDNFVLKLGDNIITIKKPQGILRSIVNLAEYIQDLVTGHIEGGKEGEKLGEWLRNAIMDNLPADKITGVIPNAITPIIENAINKDFYYNTEIVKSYDLNLPDEEQYYDYNSQLAILLGKIFNYSPAKIDNLISGYLGGLGTQITDIIDWASGKLGLSAEEPNMGAEQNAIGKRFVVNVNTNSASIDEVYSRRDELTKKLNGGTITADEEEELDRIKEAISSLSSINKQIKAIKQDLTMSGKDKAEKIRPLQEQKTDIARQALGKDLIYPENEIKIESTKFYPSSTTLKYNGYSLELTEDMKKEYENLAYEKYKQYKQQGLYNEEYLEKLETTCKDYAKKTLMQKYKNQLVKSK